MTNKEKKAVDKLKNGKKYTLVEIIRVFKKEGIENFRITRKEYSVSERSLQIRKILKKRGKCEFTSLFDELSKPYVIVTFLSVLEMAKNNELNITQDKNFGSILLEMK